MGSIAAALPGFTAWAERFPIGLVTCPPDRPRGRGQKVTPGPISRWATEKGYRQAHPINSGELLACLREGGYRRGLVIGYGMILPKSVIEFLEDGLFNLHFSLLPRWRGAAPVARAIWEGEERTGISLMQIDPGLDSGPVLGSVSTAILADDNTGSLTGRLAQLGGELIREYGHNLSRQPWLPIPQISDQATYAPKLQPDEYELDLRLSALRLVDQIRALAPKPGAYIDLGTSRLKVFTANAYEEPLPPGQWGSEGGREPLIGTGEGGLELRWVQASGKKPMSGLDWWRGQLHPPAWIPKQ